jgi:hypothetical protein
MTPWQARLALLGFLLLASAISANLLLFQGERSGSLAARPKPEPAGERAARPRTAPAHRAEPRSASAEKSPAASAPGRAPKRRVAAEPARSDRGARQPSTTASTR